MRFRVLSPGAALCGLAVVSCAAPSDSDERVAIARSELGQGLVFESEPNGTVALATPLGTDALIRAAIFPAGDVDYYSFNAAAGDRVHVATMTAASVYGDDTIVDLLDTDGVTVLQTDDDNGSFRAQSSSTGLCASRAFTWNRSSPSLLPAAPLREPVVAVAAPGV